MASTLGDELRPTSRQQPPASPPPPPPPPLPPIQSRARATPPRIKRSCRPAYAFWHRSSSFGASARRVHAANVRPARASAGPRRHRTASRRSAASPTLNSSAGSRRRPAPPPETTRSGRADSAAAPRRPRRCPRCRDSRRPNRRRARGNRGSARAGRRTSARTPSASRICLRLAVDLHHALAAHALREVLVGRPDAGPSRRDRLRCERARPTRARRRLRARPSATRRRPSRRALPRADGIARSSAGSMPSPVL